MPVWINQVPDCISYWERDIENWCRYTSTPEVDALAHRWGNTNWFEDQVIGGILADLLDENRDILLTDATGPSDPADRLDRLIAYLRNRCLNPNGV